MLDVDAGQNLCTVKTDPIVACYIFHRNEHLDPIRKISGIKKRRVYLEFVFTKTNCIKGTPHGRYR